jgi:hypothetical protein
METKWKRDKPKCFRRSDVGLQESKSRQTHRLRLLPSYVEVESPQENDSKISALVIIVTNHIRGFRDTRIALLHFNTGMAVAHRLC